MAKKQYPKTEVEIVKFDAKTYTYKFGKGNMKLGKDGSIATWSTLKGDKPIYIPNLGYSVVGTCVNCEDCTKYCYVNKSYNRYPLTSPFGHAKNTLGLSICPEKVFSDLDKFLTNNETSKRVKNHIKIVRINQSGEIQNIDQIIAWCSLAMNHPKIKFYVYTKNYDVAEEFILNFVNKSLPKNFHILYSIWHNVGVKEFEKVRNVGNVHAFIYSDGFEGIKTNNYCPAYNEKGKMDHRFNCNKCTKCFSNSPKNKLIACYEH